MIKTEKRILDFINKHLDVIVIIGVTIIALVVRFVMRNFESGDFLVFLENWFSELQNKGLRGVFESGGVGNYNCPYIILMWLLTKLPFSALLSIKMLSVVFDFGLAIMAGLITKYLILKCRESEKAAKFFFVLVYSIVVLLPTIILNSSVWAQCDSIYAFFALASIYALIRKKYTLSFILLGCSFAFKLQFIFILPVYIFVYFKNRDFSIANLLWIPVMLIILSMPAIVCGLPFLDIFKIYFNQIGEYKYLTLNMMNIYQIFEGNYGYVGALGYIVCVILFGGAFYYIMKYGRKIEDELLVSLMLFSVLVCVTFLPSMHERYAYLAGVLSIIYWAVMGGRLRVFVPIIMEIVSLMGYFAYLFNMPIEDYRLMGMLPLVLIIYVGSDCIKLCQCDKNCSDIASSIKK